MDDFAIDGDGAVFHLKGMAKYSSWPRTSLMHFFKGMAEYSSWPRRTSLMHLLDGVWMSIWAFSYVEPWYELFDPPWYELSNPSVG